MSAEYTQEKFESDLKELGLMLEKEMKGGAKKKSSKKKTSKKMASKKMASKKMASKKMASKKKTSKKMVSKKMVSKKMASKKSKKGGSEKKNKEPFVNNEEMKYKKVKNNMLRGGFEHRVEHRVEHKVEQEQNGGVASNKRHFKISELNGKEVDFGSAEIKSDRTPLSAAKKLLKSIAHHMGLYGNSKSKLSVTYKIRETTRGRAKEYGPYHGKYHKYSANELKDAMTKGGKIAFKMKPLVKKMKSKNHKMMNHKGGR